MTNDPINIIGEGVLARLRARVESLSLAEQRVAMFIEQHPDETVHLPLQALAERIGVSDATIIRCCQALGFRGLRDLKLALAAESATPLRISHADIAVTDSPATIARKVLQSDMQKIADTLAVLDFAAFEQAVAVLAEAKRIEFYGVGTSLPIAFDAAYRFMRAGLPATALTDPLMQLVAAAQLGPGSVAFAISHSGRSHDTRNALQVAREAGATCLLLSSHANTPIGEQAHIQLITADRETMLRTEETLASRIAHLSVMDALHVAVSVRRLDSSLEALARTRAMLAKVFLKRET
jgi:DNA-binding MurR/RpiR family transcriptional regulator